MFDRSKNAVAPLVAFAAFFALFLVGFLVTEAHAEVVLAPSAEGHFGAWLVAGPFPGGSQASSAIAAGLAVPAGAGDGAIHPALGERLPGALKWLSWSLVDGAGDVLDIARAVHSVKSGAHVLLGGVLELSTPLDGWFLVSADGSVGMSVDGHEIWRRATPHARGASWDPISLRLAPGAHQLVFDLERADRVFAFDARVLEKATLAPPSGARLRLPGTSGDDESRVSFHLARIELDAGLLPQGYQPRVRITFPRGAPGESGVHFMATPLAKGAPLGPPIDLGGVPSTSRGIEWLEASLPALSTVPAPSGAVARVLDELRVRAGTNEATFHVNLDAGACRVVERALALRAKIEQERPATLSDVDVVLATLEGSVRELALLVDHADPSAPASVRRLSKFVDRLEAEEDPLQAAGVLSLFHRSRFDGQPEPLRLHVPRSYEESAGKGTERKFPLVVVLHGLGSTPERVMTAFLGSDAEGARPAIDGFILAPHGHGDAFYRGPGETDVLETIDWVVRNYPIDETRISITGHSMGGTGAAHFALRYPDRFTGVAALAGYQSYFVRGDVVGRPLRTWERTELSRWSPASFAENGRDSFLFVAQGQKDLPLINSRVLSGRLRSLGLPVEEAWPDIGHDVWQVVWDGGKLWPKLTARQLDRGPARVVLKTDSLRFGTRRWVAITALDRYDAPASIDARVATPTRIEVRTAGTLAFGLSRDAPGLPKNASLVVDADGQPLSYGGSDALTAHREGTTWVRGTLPSRAGLAKLAGLEGPIRDAFTTPLAFVYGTLDPRQTRAAREVAEHFRRRWAGNAVLPVFADVEVPDDVLRTHSLFLVGSKDANRVVRALDGRLPFGIAGNAVRVGRTRIAGDDQLGFVAIYPNPEEPDRYVVVLEAANAGGLFRSMSLPAQLPDFIVFDSALAPAAGQQVLGTARVLGAGYFDRSWALPASLADSIIPTGAR